MNGLTAYALSKAHTNSTVDGLGYLKGAPCTIKSIVENDDNSVITFEWTGTSGATESSTLTVKNGIDGKDGLSIKAISITQNNMGKIIDATATLSDDSSLKVDIITVDSGESDENTGDNSDTEIPEEDGFDSVEF